jgi:hypothetical protein
MKNNINKLMNQKYGFAIPALTLALANMMYGQTLHPAGATVNGPLLVQPAVAVIPGVPVVTPGPGVPTNLGGVQAGTGGNVILTQTLIDTTNNSQVVTGAGGASIQTNGDTQLSAPTSTTSTVNYGRAVTFEVAQAGNSNPVGLAIPGTQVYYLTNSAGLPVVGAPTFASEALLNAYIATLTPATMLSLDPTLGTQVTAAGAGGNLTVDGATTTNGIDNSGEQITNVAAGVAPTDAANVGQVTAEATARAAADTALQTNITAEATARANADTVLTTGLANEVTNRIADVDAEEARALAAEGVLTTGLANEVTNRIADVDAEEARALAAEGILTTGLANEVTNRIADVNAEEARALAAEGILTTGLANEVTNRTNADTTLQNNINAEALTRSNADTLLQSNISAEALTRSNRDTQLQNNITNESNQRIAGDRALSSRIDTNTRGIAMVAAMTNTSVAPGMKQAVDFNVANFEGETGFGLGYAYRVNENLQVQGAAASTNDMEDSVVRVGLSYQW